MVRSGGSEPRCFTFQAASFVVALILGLSSLSAHAVEDAKLFEDFAGTDLASTAWVPSTNSQYNGVAKLEGEALVLPEEARRYGVSKVLGGGPLALGGQEP